MNSPAGVLFVTATPVAAAATVAVTLTTPPVVRAFRRLMEPGVEWFFAPERPSRTGAGAARRGLRHLNRGLLDHPANMWPKSRATIRSSHVS